MVYRTMVRAGESTFDAIVRAAAKCQPVNGVCKYDGYELLCDRCLRPIGHPDHVCIYGWRNEHGTSHLSGVS
jgi:hypothetical protein